MTVPGNTKLMSQWNGIFSISGNTMTVKNESYNGTIEKGKSISFGFNYSADAYINEGKVTEVPQERVPEITATIITIAITTIIIIRQQSKSRRQQFLRRRATLKALRRYHSTVSFR